MKDIYIDNTWFLQKYFNKDFVSLEEVLSKFEDLVCENDRLQEELDDLKQDLQDNYKPIPPEEQYD